MTDPLDKAMVELLRKDAPAARDPLFRVQVLERLERSRYRRRLYALLLSAVVLAVLAVIGAAAGGSAREATGVLLFGAAVTAVYFVVAPGMTQLFVRFGGSSKKS
jgi:peptidoglycan/LPS O-acetylase OafA/YrhL